MTIKQNFLDGRILNDFPRGEYIDGVLPSKHPAYIFAVSMNKAMTDRDDHGIPYTLSEQFSSLSGIREFLLKTPVPEGYSICCMDFSPEQVHVLPPHTVSAFNTRYVFKHKTLTPTIKGKFRASLNIIGERISLNYCKTQRDALINYQETKIAFYSNLSSHKFLLPLLEKDLLTLRSNKTYHSYG